MNFLQFMMANRQQVLDLTLEHITLAGVATLLAALVGIPLGILITRVPRLSKPVLGGANIIQTIPSLALFGFLLPAPWIGERAGRLAILALALYGLLPLIRNTYAGIQGVDPVVVEAGRAMGLTDWQLLFQVELPLASGIIVAGLRIATVLSIGLATIAAAIGAGGLGEFIFRGLAMVNNQVILAGAIPAALLALFLLNETRAAQPITPLRLFADKSRSGSFVARLLLVAGMMGMFFFLTQFIQEVLGFSPILAGVAFLPMTVTLFAVSRAAPRLIPRFGPKPLMIAGMLPVIAGMAMLSQVSPGTSYWSGVFPAMMLFGLGMGVVFVPLTTVSLAGVRPEESGAASSMVNVMQQVGGALGLAVLVAVYGTASRGAAAHPIAGLTAVAQQHHILAHGMSAAFALAAIFDVVTLVLFITVIRGRPRKVAAVPDSLEGAEFAEEQALIE